VKRLLPAAVVVLVLVVAAGVYWKTSTRDSAKGATKSAPPAEVGVVKLVSGPVTVFEEYAAQTDAPEVIEIRSQVTGLVERQAVVDGAPVRKGDLLYVIDRRPFEQALAQAKANLAQAVANDVIALQRLERSRILVERNFVSKQDYDTALAAQEATRAAVDAQKALVKSAEINLEFTVLRAPREGVISKSLVKAGSLVKAQDTLLNTLYSGDPMYVYFSVSEGRLADLKRLLDAPTARAGETAQAFQIRLVDGSEYKYPGRLDFVDAALDEKTGTLRTRLSIPNPGRVLRPGQFVRVIVPALERPDAIRIPQKAVQELQGLKSVFVVGADGKAASRAIEARYRAGNDWVVDKGLAVGDVLIVEGMQKVRTGSPVKPVEAGANPAPAATPPAGAGPDKK